MRFLPIIVVLILEQYCRYTFAAGIGHVRQAIKCEYYFRFDLPAAAHIKCRMLDVTQRIRSEDVAALPAADRLAFLRRTIEGPIVFTHGFGIEGQLICHWICAQNLDIEVVTLDTGRLFPETYTLWAETERRYGRRIRAIYPNRGALERLVAKQGINGIYSSKEARAACCDVRKTRPLDRALAGAVAWITGLRADQNANRHEAGLVGLDASRGVLKFNPLYDWTREAVLAEAHRNDVPINALHAKGFVSIGCAPCTRAIAPGEPERNGRWWWEQDGRKECGLHLPRRHAARPELVRSR
jgi:phosphoadenosine phosphosulfate reductase